LSKAGPLHPLEELLGMIWSVSTSSRFRTLTGPVMVSIAFI